MATYDVKVKVPNPPVGSGRRNNDVRDAVNYSWKKKDSQPKTYPLQPITPKE
jgi:hypothetical protein